MKRFISFILYTLICIALLQGTFLFFFTVFWIIAIIKEFSFELDQFYLLLVPLMCVAGYFGLHSLLFGFHKSRHKLKLILLGLGITGFIAMFFSFRPNNLERAIQNFELRSIFDFSVLIFGILFFILTLIDYKKQHPKRMPLKLENRSILS